MTGQHETLIIKSRASVQHHDTAKSNKGYMNNPRIRNLKHFKQNSEKDNRIIIVISGNLWYCIQIEKISIRL